MQSKFLLIVKYLIIVFGAFVLLGQAHETFVSARETQSEEDEARSDLVAEISELVAEINYFYLHPNAADFMNNFYTRESSEHLTIVFVQAQERKIPNWETELDSTELTELYQLLRSGVAGLRPIMIRRGEATAQNVNLNFRAAPETETQVFYTLTYGTPFEILEEVHGGVVTGADLVQSSRWFRIRHNDQSGYVHGRYVRNLPVSEARIRLLADIARQELWIQSKIDGWRTQFSENTRSELQELLSSARTLQTGNWQFGFNYSELNHLLQSLSYEHLNITTLFRYNLINDIVELKREIENNIQGTGNARTENYTATSWGRMDAAFTEAQELLNEDWQYNLSDEELEFTYELLLSGLNGLEFILKDIRGIERVKVIPSNSNLGQIFIIGALALGGLAGAALIFKIKRQPQESNE